MQITVPGNYSSEHAEGIFTERRTFSIPSQNKKQKKKKSNEIKISVTNRGIQVVVLLYRMFFVVFSFSFL